MTDNFSKVFAQKLTHFMGLYKMSQKTLATRVGVSEATISNWVKGIKCPRIDKVDKLCEIFNCNRSDLVDNDLQGLDRELVDNYRMLDPDSQALVDSLITLLQTEQPNSDKVLEMIGRLSAILHS